jgi:RNA-directed DNA polymerase
MQVSHGEGVASHTGPESCGDARKGVVEALTGERAGWVWSPEILIVRDADALMSRGRPRRAIRQCEDRTGLAGSKTPRTHRSDSRGSREIPDSTWALVQARAVNRKGTTAMHESGKSDRPIVPAKSSNNGGASPPAEKMEGRGLAKESPAGKTGHSDPEPRTACPMTRRGHVPGIILGAFDLRQEPGAVNPPAGIRAGGGGKPPSLPRP